MSDFVFDDGSERVENGFEELGYALALEDEYLDKFRNAVQEQTKCIVYKRMGLENISEKYMLENQDDVDCLSENIAKYRAASMAQQIADDLRDGDFREEFYSLEPFERTSKVLEKGISEEKFMEFLEEEFSELGK